MKIYLAAVQVLSEKERQDETEFTTKIDGFPSLNANVLLAFFFLNLTLGMTQLRGAVFSLLYG